MRSTKLLGLMLAATLVWVPTALQAQANQPGIYNQEKRSALGADKAASRAQSGSAMDHSLQRADQLINSTVYNAQGEKIGDVKDIVLETSQNRVEYVVLSFGGFLGIGSDLHAIPWHAFDISTEAAVKPDESSDSAIIPNAIEQSASSLEATPVLTLNVAKETLESAKGFDKSNWPDMANQSWRQQNNPQYGDTVDRSGEAETQFKMRRLSNIIGMEARIPQLQTTTSADPGAATPRTPNKVSADNRDYTELGEIEDIVIDADSGRIVLGLVTIAKLENVKEDQDQAYVPWKLIDINASEESATVNSTPYVLQSVAFAKDSKLDLSNSRELDNLHAQFGIQPEWQTYGFTGEAPDKSKDSRHDSQHDSELPAIDSDSDM